MKIIGKPGDVIAPQGWLEGPFGKGGDATRIQINSIQTSFAVGTIPTCRVSVPIEALDQLPQGQTNDVCKVMVSDGTDDHVLFTGYCSGPRGRISGNSVSAGMSLIHIARDLDQCRLSAPGIHPASVDDFNYVIASRKASREGLGSGRFFVENDVMPKEIIENLIKELNNIEQISFQNVGNIPGVALKDVSFAPAIELLKKIKVLNGQIKGEIFEPLTSNIAGQNDQCINAWVHSKVKGGLQTTMSLWDVLASIFTAFGLQIICDNLGGVSIAADTAGFTAPDANLLGASYITAFDWNSLFTRDIYEVNLIANNVASSAVGGPPTEGATLYTYPDKEARKGATGEAPVGGSLTLLLPGWLEPITIVRDEKELQKAFRSLAQMFFYLERSKLRTISISGPLAPNVVPGTNAIFEPFSKVAAKSGQPITITKTQYTGYCYKVDHVFDGSSNTLQTNFSFRNISSTESKETVASHPIFSDVKPFVWK